MSVLIFFCFEKIRARSTVRSQWPEVREFDSEQKKQQQLSAAGDLWMNGFQLDNWRARHCNRLFSLSLSLFFFFSSLVTTLYLLGWFGYIVSVLAWRKKERKHTHTVRDYLSYCLLADCPTMDTRQQQTAGWLAFLCLLAFFPSFLLFISFSSSSYAVF